MIYLAQEISYENMDTWKSTTDAKYGVGKNFIFIISSIDPIYDPISIFKSLRSVELTSSSSFYLTVVYNFDGNVTHGLRLTIGETVHIFEECAGEN